MLALQYELWKIAAPVGSLHSYWDVIFDIELLLKRGRPILTKTAEEWIAYMEELIRDVRENEEK